MNMGEYQVVGTRRYRDHPPGTVFQARIDRAAEARAIARGDIRLVRVVVPTLQPGTFALPPGWDSGTGKE